MKTTLTLTHPIIEDVEEYSKTRLYLFKLKSIDKTANLFSLLITRLFTVIILSFFVLTLNIAAGLFIGSLIGKNYYGFFIVALFYGVVAIIWHLISPFIKIRLNNALIIKMLK